MTWTYRAPGWLGDGGAHGGHLQTLWPALVSHRLTRHALAWRRQRWLTPDGDFIDTDFLDPPAPAVQAATTAAASPDPSPPQGRRPLLVLFHGLEGSARSHYAVSFAMRAHALGWAMAVPHFRGCSGELNLAPRAYHSGDHEEIGWILQQLRQGHTGDILAVGISLGANALLRWAEENGHNAHHSVQALVAISAPLDLMASGHALGRGLNQQLYTRMFMRSLKPKALAKLHQHPGLFDRDALLAARNLYDFDNIVTAPLHGFRNTEDYWTRASAKPRLRDIRLPTLIINARNDPFVPGHSLPCHKEVSRLVTLWQPRAGGHVGFPGGPFPAHIHDLPCAVTDWLQRYL